MEEIDTKERVQSMVKIPATKMIHLDLEQEKQIPNLFVFQKKVLILVYFNN
jgi:hypothetical protein